MFNIQGTVGVIGDVMLDVYLYGKVSRLSPEAPVPIVDISQQEKTLGGAGNVALNLIGLGCKVHLFGTRGNDLAGDSLSSILSINKIENNLYVDKLCPTTIKTRIMVSGQQLMRFDEEKICNGNGYTYLCKVMEETLPLCKILILSDYGKGVLSEKILEYIWHNFKGPILVDPKRSNWEYYRGATIVTPNVSELEKASNECCDSDEAVLNCAERMRGVYDFKAIIVTRGEKGILVVLKDAYKFIPTVAKSVFNVSGAGDTVISVLAASICSGYSIIESAEIANIAAGIVVGKVGTSPIHIDELKSVLSY